MALILDAGALLAQADADAIGSASTSSSRSLENGTLVVDCLSRDELRSERQAVEQPRDLQLGLSDAPLVVLAQPYSTTRIVTFDERAFRAVVPPQGGPFTVLPADLG